MIRHITFVGGPKDGQQTAWNGGKTFQVSEPVQPGLVVDTPLDRPREPVPLRHGIYERDPANPYRFEWKGWKE